MKRLFFISLLFLVGVGGFGQSTFQKNYGGTNSDHGYSMQQTTDSGFVIAGGSLQANGAGSMDVYIIKTDKYGDTLWTKIYGTSGADYAQHISQTSDNGYILTGWSTAGPGSTDFYTIRTDENGDTLWTKFYGHPTEHDKSLDVRQTIEQGYIIIGWSPKPGCQGNAVLIKTDQNGNSLWIRIFDFICGTSVQTTSDSGYVFVGSACGGVLYPNRGVFMIKVDSDGDSLWTKHYDFDSTKSSALMSIRQTTDGGFINAGYYQDSITQSLDVLLIKTDSVGNIEWAKRYDESYWDGAESAMQTTDGGYIVTGYTNDSASNDRNVLLIKTNALGDVLWAKQYGGSDYEHSYSVQQTYDNGYAVGGDTWSFGSNDIYLVKTDSLGNSGCYEYSANPQMTNLNPKLITDVTIGAITINITNPNTLVNTAIIQVDTICDETGVDDNRIMIAQEIVIYPNPTTGVFTVTGKTGPVQVFDLLGREIAAPRQAGTGNDGVVVDLSSYPAGVYLVKVGEQAEKLILTK